MTTSLATVFCKTDSGLDEMQRRQAGLNPRVRQLLILVDGKRSVAELQRMIAVTEFEECLSLLELKGLIQPVGQSSAEVMFASAGEPPEAVPQLQESLPVAAVAVPESQDLVERDRAHLARLLGETVGPMSDELCGRISRARRAEELDELYVAAVTVVELMSGRKAVDRFIEKLHMTGWEH